jgi:hypothetical protein
LNKTKEEIEQIAEQVVDAMLQGRLQAHGQWVMTGFAHFLCALGDFAVNLSLRSLVDPDRPNSCAKNQKLTCTPQEPGFAIWRRDAAGKVIPACHLGPVLPDFEPGRGFGRTLEDVR